MGKKKYQGLKPQKMTRQQSKLLMRVGGELAEEDIMLGSITQKMRKGGNAERIVKDSKGKEKNSNIKWEVGPTQNKI